MPNRVATEFANGSATEASDLAERLARYRSRVAREGRKSALERLDRAIDEARRLPKKPK